MASNENQPASGKEAESPTGSPKKEGRSAENLEPLGSIARPFFNAEQHPVDTISCRLPLHKELFFFYGSLMDPPTLSKVLNLNERPRLHPATIIGYHCDLWGPYPALLDGPRGARVEGVAFEVQSAEQVQRLEAYETKRYRKSACHIHLKDGSKVSGKTFVWDSDIEQLHAGVFDLKDFQMKRLEMG